MRLFSTTYPGIRPSDLFLRLSPHLVFFYRYIRDFKFLLDRATRNASVRVQRIFHQTCFCKVQSLSNDFCFRNARPNGSTTPSSDIEQCVRHGSYFSVNFKLSYYPAFFLSVLESPANGKIIISFHPRRLSLPARVITFA